MTNTAVSVSTSATQLVDGQPNRTLLVLTNTGAVTVYLGTSAVSTSSFIYALAAGEFVQFTGEDGDVAPQGKWYGVTPSSTASVSVGEITR